MHFGDELKAVGLQEEVRVHLSREDGLRLLKTVTRCNSPMIERHAQEKFTIENGNNCLRIAGLLFSWPTADACPSQIQAMDGSNAIDITPYPKQLN